MILLEPKNKSSQYASNARNEGDNEFQNQYRTMTLDPLDQNCTMVIPQLKNLEPQSECSSECSYRKG